MEEKEEKFLKRRFLELADLSYQRAIPIFSDFLTLYEQDIFLHMTQTLPPVNYKFFGGCPFVERVIVAFIPQEWDYELDYPIDIVEITPVNARFSDTLSHRDILGAIMHTGVERAMLGDILIDGNLAYVMILHKMSAYICSELQRIKHTTVKCRIVAKEDITWKPKVNTLTASVSSVRLDSVSAAAFHISRTAIQAYIAAGKLFVNGRLISSNGYNLKDGDKISVRGVGKYEFICVSGVSKKGKMVVKINQYT